MRRRCSAARALGVSSALWLVWTTRCGLDDGDAAVDAQAADVRQVADDGEVLSQFFVGKGERVAAAQDDFFYLRVCGEVGGDGGDFALAQCLAAAADVFFAEAEAAVHGADGRDFPQDAVRVAVYQRGQRRVGCVADGVGQFARGDGEFARVGDELGGDGVVRRVVHGGAHFVAHRVLVFGKQAVQGGGGEVGAPREFFRGHEGDLCGFCGCAASAGFYIHLSARCVCKCFAAAVPTDVFFVGLCAIRF